MGYSNITIKDIPSIIISSLILSLIPLFAVIFVLDEIDKSERKEPANHESVVHAVVSSDEAKPQAGAVESKSLSVTDDAAVEGNEYAKVASTSYNNIARYIAGMPQIYESDFSRYENYPSWRKYSLTADKRWKELGENKFRKITAFRESELQTVNESIKTVFYPFSGPDFLHSYLFFPKATEFILIGPEKVGELPDLRTLKNDSLLAHYISYVNRSLHDVLSLSFFITKKMKTDFKNSHLEGLLPALMVFIARTDHVILDIRLFNLNADGSPLYLAKDFRGMCTGVEILFKDSKNTVKKLQYLSVNLADNEMKTESPAYQFINRIGDKVTYLKAASYLMHYNYFSIIRNYILRTSTVVLQDDSGIPYKYFSNSEWNKKLFGSYSGTIGLFAGRRQKDLIAAYEKPGVTRNLDFGIGYKYRKGSSNLMLAIKDLKI